MQQKPYLVTKFNNESLVQVQKEVNSALHLYMKHCQFAKLCTSKPDHEHQNKAQGTKMLPSIISKKKFN
jgi:hypothetical protein